MKTGFFLHKNMLGNDTLNTSQNSLRVSFRVKRGISAVARRLFALLRVTMRELPLFKMLLIIALFAQKRAFVGRIHKSPFKEELGYSLFFPFCWLG
jgi:hypothetical protein